METTDRFLISCDWGTSSFRIRLVQGTPGQGMPSVAAERSDRHAGIAAFVPGDSAAYARHAAREIEELFRGAGLEPRPVPVWLSGMITSSLGWKQLPYAGLPFRLDGSAAVIGADTLTMPDGRVHELFFVSGVKAADDVMRGEECELIGMFSVPELAPYSGAALVLIPGTHSKCIEVRDGCVTGFRTFLTGELFDLLCRHSILRHSVGREDARGDAGEEFEKGTLRASESGLLASLFSVRARSLLEGIDPERNRAYLSGLLIGDELSAVKGRVGPGTPILLCGTSDLTALYRRACKALGLQYRLHQSPPESPALAASIGHWRLDSLRVG